MKKMIELLTTEEPPAFVVMLSKYYIEGKEYSASALTVSKDETPNVRATDTGFECDAFFRPHMVHREAREGKEIVDGFVKVRMKVNLDDVSMILGSTKDGRGSQFRLY